MPENQMKNCLQWYISSIFVKIKIIWLSIFLCCYKTPSWLSQDNNGISGSRLSETEQYVRIRSLILYWSAQLNFLWLFCLFVFACRGVIPVTGGHQSLVPGFRGSWVERFENLCFTLSLSICFFLMPYICIWHYTFYYIWNMRIIFYRYQPIDGRVKGRGQTPIIIIHTLLIFNFKDVASSHESRLCLKMISIWPGCLLVCLITLHTQWG